MIEPGQITYLDNNATTQLDPAVVSEMLPFLTEYYGNPSSGYGFATQVRDAIELARERVAKLLGCEPREIVFTSGGTESNNSAIASALALDPARRHVVTTAVEHSAVRRFCEHLESRGCQVTFLRVDASGSLDLDELRDAVRPDTAIVSVMWANNETGVIFPVEQIAAIAREKGVLFHTDAVQAVGKVRMNLRGLPINFLSLSGHKLHAPKGVGALYVNSRTAFRPSIFGGSHEDNRRAGTENVASIVALGKAAEIAARDLEEEAARLRPMRDRFEAEIRSRIADVTINGADSPRLPNTSNLSFPNVESNALLVLLDRHGICCSAGSACRTGSTQSSHVLRAMSVPADRINGSVRVSFGRFNTDADVARAIDVLPRVVSQLTPAGATA